MGNTGSEETGQKPTEIAWAAGLIDGEGTLAVFPSPSVTVDNTSKEVVEALHLMFGGKCYALNRLTNAGRQVFRWRVCGAEATQACLSVADHLREKDIQAILLSRFHLYPPRSAMRESLRVRMKHLKRAGS